LIPASETAGLCTSWHPVFRLGDARAPRTRAGRFGGRGRGRGRSPVLRRTAGRWHRSYASWTCA